jgi:hypothetical protein
MTGKRFLSGLLVVGVAIGAALSAGAVTSQNQTGPGDGPSDATCYCGQPLFGCSPPGPSFDLTATCTCTSSCSRTCTYSSKKGS